MRNGKPAKVQIRYRLRTLLLAGAFGPPLLVLAWYVGVWASFALPEFIREISGSLLWLSGLIAMGLTAFIVLDVPPVAGTAIRPSWRQLALVAALLFLAFWQGYWIAFNILGWVWVWGDNPPPGIELKVLLASCA